MPALNSLASTEQVRCSPSSADGVPRDVEGALRLHGCRKIQEAGVLLRLPEVTLGTAQILFQRFWYVSSMRSFSVADIAIGALFLASKLTETPVGPRDLINVFDFIAQRAQHRANASVYRPMDYYSTAYYDAKDALVVSEMQILKRLAFDVQVVLPHALMINYMQVLGIADVRLDAPGTGAVNISAMQCAWNFLNDACVAPSVPTDTRLQTGVYCLFAPHVLACAAIYLLTLKRSGSRTDVPWAPLRLPTTPRPWWELFDASRDEVRAAATHIVRLYDPAVSKPASCEDLAKLETRDGLRYWLGRRERDYDGGKQVR